MSDLTTQERPEAWEIGVNKKIDEVGSIGPLWATWTDVGYAHVSDVRAHFEVDDPGVINRVARLPITEWERDRAVERIAELEGQLRRVVTVTDNILDGPNEGDGEDLWSEAMYVAARMVNRAIAGVTFEMEGGDRG